MSLTNLFLAKINSAILCVSFYNVHLDHKINIKSQGLINFCKYSEDLVLSAEENKIDPFILVALIYQESRWITDLTSSVGACGLTQVIPRYLGQECNFLLNAPDLAIEAGAYVLQKYKYEFLKVHDIEKALQCYSTGVKCSYPLYSKKILQNAKLFKKYYLDLENSL